MWMHPHPTTTATARGCTPRWWSTVDQRHVPRVSLPTWRWRGMRGTEPVRTRVVVRVSRAIRDVGVPCMADTPWSDLFGTGLSLWWSKKLGRQRTP